ncbi:MAG: PhoH family protein [Planctomycetota bacterium]|nr:PhoH family protein [Planctomycetota bacterium]
MIEVTIPLRSHDEAILVLGPYDRHAKLLRQALDIEVTTRGGNLRVKGSDSDVIEAKKRVEHLLGKFRKGRDMEPREIEEILIGPSGTEPQPRASGSFPASVLPPGSGTDGGAVRRLPRSMGGNRLDPSARVASGMRMRAVEPRGENQARYLQAIEDSSLTFAVGVAGTGKTYLAVAAAVRALRAAECRRLVITRPVVEAGERLGFLPGDLQAKLNPYMRPIYDALYDLMQSEDVVHLEDAGVIEVAPLAFMRGRTLANSFVILDEAQNTTVAQMKMFLTRLGEGSRMVVTGDPTQSDLTEPRNGFMDAVLRLRGFAGVSVVEFSERDIVRHPLVQKIVRAYESPSPRG